MAATLRIHKSRKADEEPKYRLSVADGPSKMDGMGIPKEAARKAELIDRLKRLGAPDDEIERVFRELETSDHADIRDVA
jgi:hypothetical protein